MSRARKIIIGFLVLVVAGFLVLQIIPVGQIRPVLARDANPPVEVQITWDSVEAEGLLRRACYDCHSNETAYPWYAHIAPVSWLVTRDVNKGREAMNFSEDGTNAYDLGDLEWHLYNDMPPRQYTLIHPDAKLTEEQKALVLAAFKTAFPDASHEGMDMDE